MGAAGGFCLRPLFMIGIFWSRRLLDGEISGAHGGNIAHRVASLDFKPVIARLELVDWQIEAHRHQGVAGLRSNR